MPDLQKLFEKAEKSLEKQKFDSALESYVEIYKYQPNNEEVLVKLGDLSLKLNRSAEGLRFLSQLLEYYIRRNDTSKAVATCRKILKLSPQDVATRIKLAALLERSKKESEALQCYLEALELYRKAQATQQALECLDHIVKLDPENLDAWVQLADLATRARQLKVATPAFLKAAKLARKAGQENRWAELVERAYSLDPADEAGRVAAAEVFLKTNRATKAIPLLERMRQSKPDDMALGEFLARAYLSTGNYEKAEPLCWKLYQADPAAVELPVKLVDGLVQTGETQKALSILQQMKTQLFKQDKRNEFLKLMEKIYEADESNLAVLETLTSVYDEMNKEEGLRRCLSRLFNLYLGSEQYRKAGDTLETIIDVDPYGQGHHDRLLNLEGHIEADWYNRLLSRVQPSSAGRVGPGAPTGPNAASQVDSLDDLMIEGEMYHQYQIGAKLSETLEKINRLFPGVEETNARLRALYEAGGFTPKPVRGGTAPRAGSGATASQAEATRTSAASPQSLEDLRKVSEITASIFNESTPQAVMQVAVNEIGRALNSTRCWGALGTVDRPPSLAVEYCSPAAAPSEAAAALKVYDVLIHQAVKSPDGWLLEDVTRSPILAPVSSELRKLSIRSLLALPLMDRDEPAGLLLVEQCESPRVWTGGETLFLKAIATQVVIAVNSTKLRRLVQSLAGSDQELGLLPRSAYLDCLLAEAQRAKESSQPVSICLLEPENPTALVKSLGEAGVQRYFQHASKTLLSNLRQSDIAIRYTPCSIAVVFPDTALPQCGLAVEKLRQVLSQLKTDSVATRNFCAAVCDIQLGPNFDAVDGITEGINRLEAALDQARKEGGKRVLLSKFQG